MYISSNHTYVASFIPSLLGPFIFVFSTNIACRIVKFLQTKLSQFMTLFYCQLVHGPTCMYLGLAIHVCTDTDFKSWTLVLSV